MDKQSLALSKAYTDKSILGISGALAGKNCTIKSVVGNVVTFEWTADDGTTRTSTMTVSANIPQAQIEEEVNDWLEAHKEEVKGDGVQILSETETVADIKDSTVLAFSLAEDTTTEDAYTKTQSDVRFAKNYEVGDTSTIVVTDATSLVNAINRTWLAGMSSMVFDATTKSLNIVTRGGQTITIDVSQIILSTSITEFKDMLITNVLDGQSIVWNSSKQKWINKSIDSSGVLTEAKQYTDTEIAKINNKGAIACDEKPTYYGGVITYKKGGVEKQTENTGTWFYYLDTQGKAVQTIFIEGTEFTIAMAGDINLDDYVAKADVTSTYDENFTDKTKIPNTQYMSDFKEAVDEDLGEKVNTDDVTDTMGSAESPVSEDKIPNIKALKELHNAINDVVFKKANVIASTDTTTASADTNVHSAKRVDSLLDEKLDADDYVLTDLIDDTTASTNKVYSSAKIESDYAKVLTFRTVDEFKAFADSLTDIGVYNINFPVGSGEVVSFLTMGTSLYSSGGLCVVKKGVDDDVYLDILIYDGLTKIMASRYNLATKTIQSINIVNNRYSTDESPIGTWIDGKPIYRKVFTELSFGVDTEVSVWHSTGAQLTDGKDLVSAIAVRSNNGSGNSTVFSRFDFRLLNNAIDYMNTSSVLGTTIDTLIVEYTKAD